MPLSSLILAAALGQADSMAQLKQQVIVISNRERRKVGLGELAANSALAKAAQAHADDMSARGYFSHTTPEGGEFWERTKAAGYTGEPRGENIAKGAFTAAKIMDMWMKSRGHREGILNPDSDQVGIGFARRGSLAVMVLGKGGPQAPPPPPAPISLVFPVLGGARFTDTYLAPRPGGRLHMGQDLMAEHMRPLLAAFDGRWTGGGIERADGVAAVYIHLNNDRPGTDDGQAHVLDTYAPGVWPGVQVLAGQLVAYNGDSGNAENVGHHLHFELIVPGEGNINPFAALKGAAVLQTPRYQPEHPELLPIEGQSRWDAEVREIDAERKVAVVDLAAVMRPDGGIEPSTKMTRRFIRFGGVADIQLVEGDFLAALGAEPPAGQAMSATGIKVFRSRHAGRR